MNLEQLLKRAEEIETAIVNTANQLQALAGHKGETQYWIKILQDIADKPPESVAPVSETPVQ